MADADVESIVWLFGLAIFAGAALFPQHLIRLLGQGRVTPSSGTLVFLRIASAVCVLGTIYRLIKLHYRQ
jgi:hypothetical protein